MAAAEGITYTNITSLDLMFEGAVSMSLLANHMPNLQKLWMVSRERAPSTAGWIITSERLLLNYTSYSCDRNTMPFGVRIN